MYRLIPILFALAFPIVGIAQICIDSEDEFVFGAGVIYDINTCSPTILSVELIACELDYISVDLSQVDGPDMIVIDIRQPGAECSVRFASLAIFESPFEQLLYDCDLNSCDPFFPMVPSPSPIYIIDASIFSSATSGATLSGTWEVGLSYLGSNVIIPEIRLDFIGLCCMGCTYSVACNYDSNATTDDGSCEFASCGGCIDALACNYEPNATIGDGSCIYPDTGYDCVGNCLADSDGDGICDSFEVSGCTEALAENYNPAATEDDGSCFFSVNGCTYSDACNYNPSATSDDGSCIFGDGVLTLEIQTDQYPDETTWDITDLAGTVVALGGPYDTGNALFVVDICLDAGCYTFTIYDSFGDGLCCVFGLGSYTLNFNGIILASGAQFGFAETHQVCLGTQGCTYPNACNYDAEALEDDGTCLYPADLDACDCDGNQPDALGECGGNCFSDFDGDGVCDSLDECVGTVDPCGVCNGPGAIYDCGCTDMPQGDCDCSGTPCSSITDLLEIDNPFLELSYVQNAAPFFSVYDGWLDADFVTIGICRPQAILEPPTGNIPEFNITITFDGFQEFFSVDVPEFQQEFTLQLPSGATGPITASQIVQILLQDDLGNTLDRLYQDGTPWPNVTLNEINHAPGQHRVVRQPWVLQGNTEVEEFEWLVCDENWPMPFYSSWNLESTTQVPLDPTSDALMPICLNDLDGDGICDQLEMPVFCQNVNATNYSPLYYTLICDEAEVLEYWISSFNLSEIAQQGGLLPPLPPGQQPESSAMVASDVCTSGASQLAYCNYGQRAFVVDENNQTVQIIDYGDLANPEMIPNDSGGFLSILADDMATELGVAGVTDITTLVPSDVDIFNVVGPDDTTYCCSTMVAVAWIDTFSLNNSGWVTLHDINGGLLPFDAIQEVGPTPRSLAFSQDGNWLVVACSGEGEHETTDPMAEIVCIRVTGYTQDTSEPVTKHVFNFDSGSHIVGTNLVITGEESRTSTLAYNGTADLSHMLEPSHVAISPHSDRAFVNCQVNNTVVEIDLTNVLSGFEVIRGAYGFGRRDMSSGNGFDGKDDGYALVETPTIVTIEGWYQPGDMVIDTTETGKIYLLTANEGFPSKDASGDEEVNTLSGGEYDGLEIDPDYDGGGPTFPYVFGSRSFAVWDITTPGSAPDLLYDSGSLIEETLALLMPDYANSLKSTYDSGDEASVSRGPEPAGIAFGTLNDKKIIIVSLEEMGGSMIFDLINYEVPSNVSASYQAYATHRDFQNPSLDICVFNNLGAKDVLFLHSSITDNTSVTGIVEGYDAIMVSNDETGSLTLFRLDSNLKIPGCMDSCACNYNEYATLNDGSCDFDSCVTEGCTYPDADNYDEEATLDIGTCVFTNDCPADLNGDGFVSTGDLLEFLALYGTTCP